MLQWTLSYMSLFELWKKLYFLSSGLPFIPNSHINLSFKLRRAKLVQTDFENRISLHGKQFGFEGKTSLKKALCFPKTTEWDIALYVFWDSFGQKKKEKKLALLELKWAHRKSKVHGMMQEREKSFSWL